MAGTQKTFALILGIVLTLVGIAGFVSNPLISETGAFFGTNSFQNVLHLIAGIIGIWVGTKGEGPGYNMSLGWIALVLGVVYFIPGVQGLLMQLLNINTEITVLHLVIGVVTLGVYYGASK